MRQPPFGGGGRGFPQFMLLPPSYGPEPHYPEPVPDIVVPARVNKALEFLNMCTEKTASRLAASENQIQECEGQKLSEAEIIAQDTACNLLAKYFAGKLPEDQWEKLRIEGIRQKVKRGDVKGSVINCPSCGPSKFPNPTCKFCKGNGAVIITPMIDVPDSVFEDPIDPQDKEP